MFYFYRIIIHPCRLSKTEELHRGSAHLTAALSVLDQFLHWENVESRLIKCVSLSLSGLGVCVSGVWRGQSQPGAEEDGRHPAEHRQHRSAHVKRFPSDGREDADVSPHTRCSVGSVSSRSAATHRRGSRWDLCSPQWIQHGPCSQTKTGPTVMILEDLLTCWWTKSCFCFVS